MKRLLVCAAAMIFVIAAFAWAKLANTPTSHEKIVGAWKLESADRNGQPAPTGTTEIKIISKGRYVWVQYDPAKNKTLASGAGSYVFNGNSYSEHIELLDVNGQGDSVVGKDATFTVTVQGDTLSQTGTVGQTRLKETWKRMD